MPASVVTVPWYATLFRGDKFETALLEIAPVALRYGATEWSVIRSMDDTYKFQQSAHFGSKEDWERYWYGEEFAQWRADYTSWYQVPIIYAFNKLVGSGSMGGGFESLPGDPAAA